MTVGKEIAKHRNKKGLTQRELSESVGISRTYLADVEQDRYNPSLKVLARIAKELEMDINFILK